MRVGYLFILNDAEHISDLKHQLATVKDSNPIWIGVISEFPQFHDELIHELQSFNCEFNVVCNLEKISDVFKVDQFTKYKNGWTVVRIAGYPVVDNIYALEQYIEDGNKLALITGDDDSINGMCFFNFIYKYLKGSKYEIDEQDNVIFKTYEEKVSEKDPNMITTWEKLNEIYSNTTNLH